MQITAGSTDVQIPIYCRTSTGAALTGKVAADFALTYRRAGANVSISLSNLTALTDAHSDGGIKEVGNGEYRLDLPDAACAAGVNQVSVGGTVAGGVVLGYPIALDNTWSAASRTLTQSAASVIAAVTTTTGSTITIDQSYDLDVTLTGLTISAGRTKLWFSVKENRGDAEADAWLRIEQTVGLERVYKGAPTSAGNGSLTVDAVAGTVRIRVKAVETAKLVSANRQLVYDLKQLNGGVLSKLTEAAAQVILGVTLDVD
jgi:hypothetical protein